MNIKKKIKSFKFTRKRKLLLVSYLVIFMFICTSFHSIDVRADDYSTYLYQYDITLDYDYANLMEETASYENGYRNYFFSGTEFIYDTGLSEWIGLSASLRYNYVVSQTYLDNLDDERAFKQQETLIDDYSYGISDYNISEGYYNEFETNHSIGLLPNQDISIEWTGSNYDDSNDVNLHYTLIDEYITDDSDSWIEANQYDDGVIDIFKFENKNFTYNPYMIRIYLRASDLSGYASDDFKIALNYSGSWNEKIQAFTGSNLAWYQIDFNTPSLTQLQLDNIAVRVIAPTVITSSSFPVVISSLYLKVYCNGSDFMENLELDDSEYSNVNSKSSIVNVSPYNYSLYSVPLNNSFNMNNGTHFSNGSLWDIDNDYAIMNPDIQILTGFATEGGTYPATYSFTDDIIGNNPTNWTVYEDGGYVNVFGEIDAHNKTVDISDTSSISTVYTYNDFDILVSGTIEFYFMVDINNEANRITILEGSNNRILLQTLNGNLTIYSPSANNIVSLTNDIFYHVRIDFECGDGGYEGLTPNTCYVYVNEVKYGSYGFYSNTQNISRFQVGSGSNAGTPRQWIDAVGYSWDDGYNIGDNLNELPVGDYEIYNLNFTTEFQFNNNTYFETDTFQEVSLYYSHKTNVSSDILLNIWNFDLNQWDLVNYSNNYETFYDNYFVLNNSYYNSSNFIKLEYNGNSTLDFSLFIDKLTLNSIYESYYIYNSEIDIILETNVINLLEVYQLDYKLIYNLNITSNIEVYIYDFILDLWILINNDTISSEKTLTYTNTTLTNLLSPTNISLFRFILSKNYTSNIQFKLSVDYLQVKLYTSVQLYNAVHYIYISYYCYTSGGTLRGRVDTSIEVRKDYIKYDTWTKTWTGSGWLGIANQQDYTIGNETYDIESMEIQIHIRYGSGLDGNTKINVLFNAIINYNLSIVSNELIEYELDGIWSDIQMFQFTDFAYHKKAFDLSNDGYWLDSDNNKRAFSCLRGVRVLRSDSVQEYNRFFEIPYFSDDVQVGIGIEGLSGSASASEPSYPSGKYWTYETFRLSQYSIIPIVVENWTVDYNTVYAESYQAKYFYKEESISRSDLGSSKKWTVKIGDIKISFTFIRNGIATLINTVFFFFQYLFYLVVASLSYIFMYLGVNILVLLWNYLVYYIFVALIWILWYLYSALYFLFLMLYALAVYVYEVILIPFMNWLWYVAIPWIIDFLIIILAHIITIVIWMITLGEADYDTIYNNVYKMLRYIVDEIIEMLTVFVYHLDYILLFILYYLLLTGMLYMRYIYCKARGFNNRAEQLHSAFEVFVLPILFTLYLFKSTKDLVDPYTS